ncbi:hypothetical protein M0R72_07675 [Candidatus Pacearchaeota archaeon]|jgi:hypothetical protein|nr:hypothetical protein [Candidatus Pacearchaeota archaeon]
MELVTIRSQIRDVAARFAAQYTHNGKIGLEASKIVKELRKLNVETATPEDVANIIGNSDWVKQFNCDECGAPNDVLVEAGEEPDYDSQTALLCASCLREALTLISQHRMEQPSEPT